MYTHFVKTVLVVGFCCIWANIRAQVTYNWTGTVSNDWNNAANWSPSGSPGVLDYVNIPPSYSNPPHWPKLSSTISVKDLTLAYESQLDINGFIVSIANNFYSENKSVISNSAVDKDITLNMKNGNVGNIFNDNVKFFLSGNVSFGADASTSPQLFNGKLEIERTGLGYTYFFKKYIVQSDFKFTDTFGGDLKLGDETQLASTGFTVNGKMDIDIDVPNGLSSIVYLHKISNTLQGGYVSLKNVEVFDAISNEIIVNSFKLTGWKSGLQRAPFYGSLRRFEDSIIKEGGSFSLETNPAGTGDYEIDVRVTGITQVTHHGSGNVYAGGTHNGDSYFTSDGLGRIYIDKLKHNWPTEFGKNLTLNGKIELIDEVKFVGDGNTTINQLGPFPLLSSSLKVSKTNPGKIVLLVPLTVRNSLSFEGGIIESTATSPLIFSDDATTTGATDISHVKGPVRKIGNDVFTFPIGSGSMLNVAVITEPGNTDDEFSAEYLAVSPTLNGYNVGLKSTTLASVYDGGYWDVKRQAGSSVVSLSLGYNLQPGKITDQSKLRVSHWNGTLWEDLGNGGTSGSLTVGTVSTAAGVSNFSPFAIASNDISTPLPVKLVSFTVKNENKTASLRWTTAEEVNSDRFEIQYSRDGRSWTKLGEIKAAVESSSLSDYEFVHSNPYNGINYYRLKMIDVDGTFAYSRIESLKTFDRTQTALYPNPVSDKLFVLAENGTGVAKVELVNILGRNIFSEKQITAGAGLDFSKVSPGMYFVNISFNNGLKETHRIVVVK